MVTSLYYRFKPIFKFIKPIYLFLIYDCSRLTALPKIGNRAKRHQIYFHQKLSSVDTGIYTLDSALNIILFYINKIKTVLNMFLVILKIIERILRKKLLTSFRCKYLKSLIK
ncbi:hypothetical protein Avbf_15050, partial [Armadillidium vulgare]